MQRQVRNSQVITGIHTLHKLFYYWKRRLGSARRMDYKAKTFHMRAALSHWRRQTLLRTKAGRSIEEIRLKIRLHKWRQRTGLHIGQRTLESKKMAGYLKRWRSVTMHRRTLIFLYQQLLQKRKAACFERWCSRATSSRRLASRLDRFKIIYPPSQRRYMQWRGDVRFSAQQAAFLHWHRAHTRKARRRRAQSPTKATQTSRDALGSGISVVASGRGDFGPLPSPIIASESVVQRHDEAQRHKDNAKQLPVQLLPDVKSTLAVEESPSKDLRRQNTKRAKNRYVATLLRSSWARWRDAFGDYLFEQERRQVGWNGCNEIPHDVSRSLRKPGMNAV